MGFRSRSPGDYAHNNLASPKPHCMVTTHLFYSLSIILPSISRVPPLYARPGGHCSPINTFGPSWSIGYCIHAPIHTPIVIPQHLPSCQSTPIVCSRRPSPATRSLPVVSPSCSRRPTLAVSPSPSLVARLVSTFLPI